MNSSSLTSTSSKEVRVNFALVFIFVHPFLLSNFPESIYTHCIHDLLQGMHLSDRQMKHHSSNNQPNHEKVEHTHTMRHWKQMHHDDQYSLDAMHQKHFVYFYCLLKYSYSLSI